MTRYSTETRLADLARTAALPDSPCALPVTVGSRE